MDIITQMASGDGILCPVRAAAAIVKRIVKYPGSSQNSPVSIVYNHKIIDGHIQPCGQRLARCSGGNRRSKAWIQKRKHWNALD
jgi:hypothetical protein